MIIPAIHLNRADLALCSHLAFWLKNDTALIDTAFRASGLFRPKWDKKHHADGSTYGQWTIKKALEGNREAYTGGMSALRQRNQKPGMNLFI